MPPTATRRTATRRNPTRTATRYTRTYAESSDENATTSNSNSNSGWSTNSANTPKKSPAQKSPSPNKTKASPKYAPFSDGERVINTLLKHVSLNKNTAPVSAADIARLATASGTTRRMVNESGLKIEDVPRYLLLEFIRSVSNEPNENKIKVLVFRLAKSYGYRGLAAEASVLEHSFWLTLLDNGIFDIDIWKEALAKDPQLFKNVSIQYVLRTMFSRIDISKRIGNDAYHFLQEFKDMPEFMGTSAKRAFGVTRVVRESTVYYMINKGY